MKHVWILCMTIFLHLGAQAQSLIKGSVADETGTPAAFANVLLLASTDSSLIKGTITEEDGSYLFEAIPAGRYLINVSSVGYDALYSEPFDYRGGTYEVPAFRFAEAGIQLDEVVVEATKPFMELKNNKLIINVESSPVAAGNNALELLAKAPGIIIDQDNNISLKGKSGVLIMIDGKNTYMSMEELVRMLETTPATNIASIEIIDNPSAKYDAQGNAGIINIKMKKDKNLGLNGNLTAGTGYGRYEKANTAVRLNYRDKSFNLYGNYSYYYNKSFQDMDLTRRIPTETGVVSFVQDNNRIQNSRGHRASVGFDYFLNEKTTIGVLGNGRFGGWNASSDNATEISGDNPEPFDLVDATAANDDGWNNFTGNVNLRHQLDKKGHELTFDADYSRFASQEDMNNFNYFFNQGEEAEVMAPNLVRSDNNTEVIIQALKTDYTRPIGENAKLEAGIKTSFVTTDNAIDFTIFEDEQWVNDPRRSNGFEYTENIYAAYLNFNTQWKQFNIQMGLRGEQTHSEGLSVTLDELVVRDYFNLFPSFSVSHPVGDKHNLSYSYSRRIDRPSYQDLNPFVFFLDQYTFGVGNPFLQPQLTNSAGITYSLQNKLMVNINYAKTTDVMQEVLLQNDEELTTFQTRENLDNFENLSVAVSMPIGITQWWSSRVNLVGFMNRFDSEFSNERINIEQTSARVNLNNNFTLPGGMRAEMSAFYQSSVVWGIFQLDPMWSIDLGFSMPVLNGKGKLKLNVNDIFNTNQVSGFVDQGTIDVTLNNLRESRRANLTFTYAFGNDKVKPARNRRTATEEERRRVNQ